MSEVIDNLKVLLSDTYTLYLKTQNYHWHVTGPNFKELHDLFELQYTDLAVAVDDIAERIRILGDSAPATFKEFVELRTITDGDSKLSSENMLKDIHQDHMSLVKNINATLAIAANISDEGTVAILSERIADHEKMAWMIKSSF